uniref:Uncharacterized protein n=1 Tax=Megaselia scalaris TaxID=36166 RepID=T1H4A3_MEGSC
MTIGGMETIDQDQGHRGLEETIKRRKLIKRILVNLVVVIPITTMTITVTGIAIAHQDRRDLQGHQVIILMIIGGGEIEMVTEMVMV